MRIFLIGYMGSGKTSLGEKLAYKLEHEFIDLDAYIEKEEGRTISQIFEEDGEDYFRKLERVYLHRIIDKEDVIISTGGGTPCFFDNMEQMNEYGKTIYINMHPKALIPRLKSSAVTRPLLEGKDEKEMLDYIFQSLRERERYYNKAHKVVTGYNLTAQKLEKYCHQD
jgi:shikimate kinase|tara:strand:+ start:480 stop:983 length:504 start_codon:yes stop_codon:yes gene_type:complete